MEGAAGAGGGVQAFQHSVKEHKVDVFGASSGRLGAALGRLEDVLGASWGPNALLIP